MTAPDASEPAAAAATGGRYRSLPKSIWLLGMVSMFILDRLHALAGERHP